MREIYDTKRNVVVATVTASCAACVGRTLVSPYSVIKIHCQTGKAPGNMGFFKCGVQLYQNLGFKNFYRGNATACLRLLPHTTIHCGIASTIARNFTTRKNKFEQPSLMSMGTVYVAGGIGGSIAQLVTHPLDVVKTRMAVSHPSAPLYGGIQQALTDILKTEGVTNGLYRGVIPSVMGAGMFYGMIYLCLDLADNVPWRRRNARPYVPFEPVILPGLFCMAAYVATHPIDVIRKKIMVQNPHTRLVDIKFQGLLDCVANIYWKHGVFGFLKGVVANSAKAVPQIAVIAFSLEFFKDEPFRNNGSWIICH